MAFEFSINPEGLRNAAAQLDDIREGLTGAVEAFNTHDVSHLFGNNSLLADIGNTMLREGMNWINNVLGSFTGALGDHSDALGSAAQAFLNTEDVNAGISQAIHSVAEPVTQALGLSSLPAAPAPAPNDAPPPPQDAAPAPMAPPPAEAPAPAANDPHSEIRVEATPDVKKWIGEARAIMIENGTDPALIDANDLAIIAMHESGGDPNATNGWDINAQNGTPSIGLMQTIGPTFDANAMPGHTDINNPVDNIIAASNYAIGRYGSVSETPGPASVNSGGPYLPY